MKILHLNDHYQHVGGAETILFQTLDALEQHAVENVLIYQHPQLDSKNGRRAYRIPELGDLRFKKTRAISERFIEILDREKPDIVHLHDIGNPDVSQICSKYAPTVQSVYNHSYYCPGGLKYLPHLQKACNHSFGPICFASALLTHCNSVRPRQLYSSYLRCVRMKKSSHLIFLALSKYQAQHLEKAGFPPEAIQVLPPFVDLPNICHEPAKSQILFVGRVVREKGLDLLVRAFARIDPSYRLVVVGDGPGVLIAVKIARELKIENRITFTGWIEKEKLAAYYRESAVVVVPSRWPEPFGMVGIEAMSFAKPVVAFNIGGVGDWLIDRVTGFAVPAGDLQELSDKIAYLLENPEIAQRMGTNGRKRTEREFTARQHVSRLLQIYRNIIHGPTELQAITG